jgi:hypothetical protein
MPDDDYPESLDEDMVPRSQIKELEAAAKRSKELEERLANVEREAAFARALGTEVTKPAMSYFVKGYEGELDADAIRAAATEAGFLAAAAPEPVASPPADLGPHDRVQSAAAGAELPQQVDWAVEIGNVDWRDPEAEQKVLDIVEKFGGYTTRQPQG